MIWWWMSTSSEKETCATSEQWKEIYGLVLREFEAILWFRGNYYLVPINHFWVHLQSHFWSKSPLTPSPRQHSNNVQILEGKKSYAAGFVCDTNQYVLTYSFLHSNNRLPLRFGLDDLHVFLLLWTSRSINLSYKMFKNYTTVSQSVLFQ